MVPDSTKWSNVLLLGELLFSLPFSNAHVESVLHNHGHQNRVENTYEETNVPGPS